jgi:hypothetical protein
MLKSSKSVYTELTHYYSILAGVVFQLRTDWYNDTPISPKIVVEC